MPVPGRASIDQLQVRFVPDFKADMMQAGRKVGGLAVERDVTSARGAAQDRCCAGPVAGQGLQPENIDVVIEHILEMLGHQHHVGDLLRVEDRISTTTRSGFTG